MKKRHIIYTDYIQNDFRAKCGVKPWPSGLRAVVWGPLLYTSIHITGSPLYTLREYDMTPCLDLTLSTASMKQPKLNLFFTIIRIITTINITIVITKHM